MESLLNYFKRDRDQSTHVKDSFKEIEANNNGKF